MAVTSYVYPAGNAAAIKGDLDVDAGMKVLLVNGGAFDPTDTTMAQVKANAGYAEATGTGYTAGGNALSAVTVATVGQVTTLDAADPSWPASTITATGAVFYDSTGGTDATNIPVVYWDFGGAQSSNAAAFTLTLATTGLATWTAAP